MRFTANGPTIPDDLLNARDDGNVVFLCGAGISANVGLPNFKDLTKATMKELKVEPGSDADLAFRPWADADNPDIPESQKVPEGARPSFDLIFNILQQTYDRDRVGGIVAGQLSAHKTRTTPSKAHQTIARLSTDQAGNPQIVTTNFDRLFEHPDVIADPRWHVPPTFPDLRHNRPITGITYLHGRLSDDPVGPHDYVLSSADFGRAYLAEGWATRFVRMLLEKYTVVLLGYSANDPPVRYLLQGLNSSAISGNRRLYAFDRGDPSEIEARWRDRGVTPIAYGEHDELWKSLEGWATRAADPAAWRASIIKMAQTPPSDLDPFQRGQVAHIVRSAIGAKEFADADPPAPAEWICVFDRTVRTGEKFTALVWNRAAELLDPKDAFGLDDDPPRVKENQQQVGLADDLIAWNPGDQRPTDQFRLGGRRPRGFEDMPARLLHIARWISRNADKPTIAWWAARQAGIHPRLLEMIASRIENDKAMPDIAHRVWNIIFQYLERDDFGPGDMEWFRASRKINRHGWIPETLRDFETAIEPFFDRDNLMGVERVRPPTGTWTDIPLQVLAPFSVKFHGHHGDQPEVHDDAVSLVLGAMDRALARGMERLDQIGRPWFDCPSPYPHEDDEDDTDRYVPESGQFMVWYYELFNRASALSPEQTRGLVNLWPTKEPRVFDKLRLLAWNKSNLFEANTAADRILALDQPTFWNPYHRRELVHLLRDRWAEFDPERRLALENRIIKGRDRLDQDPDDEQFIIRRSDRSAAILTWLVEQGCTLSNAATAALEKLKSVVPGWRDAWARNADSEAIRSGKAGFVNVIKDDAIFDGVPVERIVQAAVANTRRPLGELNEYRPFSALVTNQPGRALAALMLSASAGEHPVDLWKSLISDWPDNADTADTALFHTALKSLPAPIIVELRHHVGPWMQDKLPAVAVSDQALALSIYDALLNGLMSGGEAVVESGLLDPVVLEGTTRASRRTLDHAINGSIGHATISWIKMLEAQKPAAGSELPVEYSSRVEQLLAAPGEGSDHAISVLGWQLNWLNRIAPSWVSSRLIPCLAADAPAAEPLWSGVFGLNQIPNPQLFGAMKQHLLGLFPKLYDWGWEASRYEPAHDWLVLACLEHTRDPAYVSYDEAIACLRQFTPEGRTHAIHFLGQFGRNNDNGWAEAVIPFIRQAWPPEVRFQVEATSAAFLSLLDDAGDSFPDLYATVRPYLRPITNSRHGLYGFYRLFGDARVPVIPKFPDLVLDMINITTPEDPRYLPYDMAQALSAIVEARPDLARDTRYIRLARLVADR